MNRVFDGLRRVGICSDGDGDDNNDDGDSDGNGHVDEDGTDINDDDKVGTVLMMITMTLGRAASTY